ncbi:P-type conjugative transfer protein TrbL [Pseudorhizobium tarimense]|uniref:P-type conjugative transfer protein TrbL n=1 Tax=Pseudorhizobium tarimense TaxID=1079109 RepID=UPI00289BAFFE|nr:P-type conjugative transfer protein TrbL [Pseudorhizobium tarimense]
MRSRGRSSAASLWVAIAAVLIATPALAQQGRILTELENQVFAAAREWETNVGEAARSLFWILAAIEIGVAAVWLALQAASIESWFAELVRRIMFVGFFAFVLDQGPRFAKAVVDSLFQLGATGGSASPAEIFDAGLEVAAKLSSQVQFGLFEDNISAIAAAFAMMVVVVCFSLVAAIFVSIMVEMYLGLLAGMIMLGLGGSSYTKDFAVRYLVYAFSVGLKLMALVMIAKIGSDVLVGLSDTPVTAEQQYMTSLAVAGIAVVVFMISIYVPNIMQGVVQGASVSGGMEVIRHGGQAAAFGLGAMALAGSAVSAAFAAARTARAEGASLTGAALKGAGAGIGAAGSAVMSAATDKAIGAPGAYGSSLLGLANAKLNGQRPSATPPPHQNDTL